jgi:hypothetical protein
MPNVSRDRRRLVNHKSIEPETADTVRVVGGQEPDPRWRHTRQPLKFNPARCTAADLDELLANGTKSLDATVRDVNSGPTRRPLAIIEADSMWAATLLHTARYANPANLAFAY